MRSSLPLSVATLLLFASKEDRFCDVLTRLATVGRAPAKKDCPIVVAACHDFETAELGAPGVTQPGDLSLPVRSEVRLAEDEDDAGELDEVADGSDVPAQESSLLQAAERERRYAEMDVLLAGEKESDAVATRAHRLAMRRLSRPVGAAVVSAEHIADDADAAAAPLPPPSSDCHVPSTPPVGPDEPVHRRRTGNSGLPAAHPGDHPGSHPSGPRSDFDTFAHLLPKQRPSQNAPDNEATPRSRALAFR